VQCESFGHVEEGLVGARAEQATGPNGCALADPQPGGEDLRERDAEPGGQVGQLGVAGAAGQGLLRVARDQPE
jgi:hypothetical protein